MFPWQQNKNLKLKMHQQHGLMNQIRCGIRSFKVAIESNKGMKETQTKEQIWIKLLCFLVLCLK